MSRQLNRWTAQDLSQLKQKVSEFTQNSKWSDCKNLYVYGKDGFRNIPMWKKIATSFPSRKWREVRRKYKTVDSTFVDAAKRDLTLLETRLLLPPKRRNQVPAYDKSDCVNITRVAKKNRHGHPRNCQTSKNFAKEKKPYTRCCHYAG